MMNDEKDLAITPENVKANSARCLRKPGVDTSGYETAKR